MSSSSESDEQLPTQGLVAGKYEIVRLIGRGGMGSVWEARHASLGTKVAIKFVEVEQAKSSEARDRFQNEARAAATIQSKHAIKVYDHGLLDDGRPYIVMELLSGEPLDSRIALLGRMSIQDTARLVMQVAKALQQAHDAGITHRDLKPENIFLVRSADDDDEVAKVLDFGIAKVTDPGRALAVSSSTKTGVLMGTPYYMSPEQARGLKTVDPRSDLWALGVIVFRCVTGRLPFTGEALGDLLVKICASPIPSPSSVAPDLSPQFDHWMAKALQREPADRFQTAAEMAESLAIVAGVSVRISSRRSYDPAPAVTPAYFTPGAPNTQGVMSRPGTPAPGRGLPMVTSSPLTASTHPPQKGLSPGMVTVFALLGLLAAGGGTYTIMMRTRTTAVAASPSPSALPVPSVSSTPPSVSSTPSSTHVEPAAGQATIAPPPTVAPTPPAIPEPPPLKSASGSSHSRTKSSSPTPLPVVAASPPPPPVVIPAPPPPPPRPKTPVPGNDPGY